MKRYSVSTVIKLWLLACLACVGIQAIAAQVVGSVAHLSGPLLAKKSDGAVKVLAQKSLVEQGDLLVTEKNTHARIRFLDGSEVTLKPGTQFRVDNFNFEEDKPQKDSAMFSLLKGGLRSVSGKVGKRNRERAVLTTPTATIGIRGTTYVAEYVPPGSSAPSGLEPGLHTHVIDGAISLSNRGGSQDVTAGQSGFAAGPQQPPVIVPTNPALVLTPPPGFPLSASEGGAGSDDDAINCEVR